MSARQRPLPPETSPTETRVKGRQCASKGRGLLSLSRATAGLGAQWACPASARPPDDLHCQSALPIHRNRTNEKETR